LLSFHFPTWQKEQKCDVLPKEKQKAITTQPKGKGNVMFLPKAKQKP
jgi:hypothetical protein